MRQGLERGRERLRTREEGRDLPGSGSAGGGAATLPPPAASPARLLPAAAAALRAGRTCRLRSLHLVKRGDCGAVAEPRKLPQACESPAAPPRGSAHVPGCYPCPRRPAVDAAWISGHHSFGGPPFRPRLPRDRCSGPALKTGDCVPFPPPLHLDVPNYRKTNEVLAFPKTT